LLTIVDIADGDDGGPDGRRLSLSARHEAVLADRRRVVLLDDRGWSEELRAVQVGDASREEGRALEPLGIWAYQTAEDIERTARVVVGPDEPFEARTHPDMEASHWDSGPKAFGRRGSRPRLLS